MSWDRTNTLRSAFAVAASVLYVKVVVDILRQYVGYFPPDFKNAAFLIGRESTFDGLYQAAFYSHIIVGPLALWLGTYQYLGARSKRFRGFHLRLHRQLGPIQTVFTILTGLSGLVMARHAYTGAIAGLGFATHSVLTIATVVLAVYYAAKKQWERHQSWSRRCVLLLVAPLFLRLMTGFTIVTATESVITYRWIAWVSWILPLAIHETLVRSAILKRRMRKVLAYAFYSPDTLPCTDEGLQSHFKGQLRESFVSERKVPL